jgi:hypothetical protein
MRFFKSPILLLLQRVKREKTLLITTKICNSKQCILLERIFVFYCSVLRVLRSPCSP